MKWVGERDLLIAQTLAFVQSVTGRKRPAESPSGFRIKVDDRPTEIAVVAAPTQELPSDTQMIETLGAREMVGSDLRREVHDRVDLFRAQQQRLRKAREDHFVLTMTRVRASLNNGLQDRAV